MTVCLVPLAAVVSAMVPSLAVGPAEAAVLTLVPVVVPIVQWSQYEIYKYLWKILLLQITSDYVFVLVQVWFYPEDGNFKE